MKGGKIIWLIDMFDVQELDLIDTNITYANPIKHELQQFLFKYGARFNVNMVNDARCSPVMREDGLGRIPNWYFYPLLYLDKPSIYLNNVGPIKTRYVCSIDTVGDDNIKKTALLKSSAEFKILRQKELNKKAASFKTSNTDMVNVEITGIISTKKDPKILWENKIEIIDIIAVSAAKETDNTLKLGTE